MLVNAAVADDERNNENCFITTILGDVRVFRSGAGVGNLELQNNLIICFSPLGNKRLEKSDGVTRHAKYAVYCVET